MNKIQFLVLALLTGCNAQDLVPLIKQNPVSLEYVDVDAQFCTAPRESAKQKIKYVFILDHSLSNQPGFPDPLTPTDVTSTDPTGSRRYGPLIQFVNNLVPDPNNLTYFSLIDFNDTAYPPTGMNGFVQDPAAFVNTYVTPDWIGPHGTAGAPAPLDQGFTNYQAALQMAYNLIQTDAQTESFSGVSPVVASSYQIIFVSDGVPTVAITNAGVTSVYTQTYLTDLSPVISSILNLKTNPTLNAFISGISLNTVYYYQNTSVLAAQTLLQQMANGGNGQYLQFGGGLSIAYQAFAPPQRNLQYHLSDFWVENKNVMAWDTGDLLLDSDGDGIPDDVEITLGSNPFSADSDGNGVSDLVEYRTKGLPCNDANCSATGRDAYAICDGLSPTKGADGRVTFPSTGGDGLNDCEKFVLGADRTTFDSNGDFIPDLLSFKNSIPFIAGTNGAFLNPFGDPLNNYLKLKEGYPITISEKKLINFEPRVNALTHLADDTAGDACYHLTSNHVAFLQAGNTLQLTLIQNTTVINNKPVISTATAHWNGQDKTMYFKQGDFR